MDLVLKLRELRRRSGLTQKEVAVKSGLGEKSISSFETGHRVGSMKISQLRKLLVVYGVKEHDFFSAKFDHALAPWDRNVEGELQRVVEDFAALPLGSQEALLSKFRLMLDTALALHPEAHETPSVHDTDRRPEWEMLTSRN